MNHFLLKYLSVFLLLSLTLIAGNVYSAPPAFGDGSVNLTGEELELLKLVVPQWKPSSEIIAVVAIFVFVILTGILLWNWTLKRQITSQTDKMKSQLIGIEEAKYMLHTVLNHIPDRVFWKDKDHNYVGCNQLFAKDAGLESPEEIVGKSDYDLVWANEADMYRADDMEAINSGEEVIEYEESRTTPDGRDIWLKTIKVPLRDAAGGIFGILGTYQDITERKEAEQELNRTLGELSLKTEDLEEVNRELSQYAYVVSHDLKTPLRAIHNYADFLREDLEDSLDGDQKEYLDGLGKAVQQSEELVNDLLNLSRVGRNIGEPEEIETGDFLLSLVKSFELPSDVEVEIAKGMPVIMAEPVLLRQIFQNIITNAVKFNPSDHQRVEIGWLPREENYVDVYVKDNGLGIDERYHKQIFSVFKRLHSREEYEGTGIGLAIVQKAAEKLNGSVRLESETGKGSTFYVSLPAMK